MRAIWKGSISFGLVNIPVSLFPATHREELKFHLLRSSDLSPINYKRVAESDGREVPWDQIVKGYEYEKGKYVVLRDEDFKRVDIEATQTVDIIDFVRLEEVDPMFFQKPYYLEPAKGGANAYSLLRDVLRETGKAGIAKVVIKTRQHLAAVKPLRKALVLELMHFAEELTDANELKIPEEKKPGAKELQMAKALVEQMTEGWDPARYTDDYTSALMKLIDEKVESGGKEIPRAPQRQKKTGKVIDLVAVLQKSLEQTGQAKKPEPKEQRSGGKKRTRKKAA
ncbi:Ku protein [Opitutaceae bacterium EW11]|nr:Ku protein [Opitutaceae bacterium EW11]